MKKNIILSLLIIAIINICSFYELKSDVNRILLENARYFDSNSGEFSELSHILIENGKIINISKDNIEVSSDNYKVIDCKGKYIVPGLTDAHIHFFQSGGLFTRPDGLDLRHRRPYSEEIALIRNNIEDLFKRYLRCGITTIVDVGGPDWNLDIRSLSNESIAPKTIVAGPLLTPYVPSPYEIDSSAFVKIITEKDARKEVLRQINLGVDIIKIWYIVGQGQTAESYFPVVKAITDESHKHGKPVYVHATQLLTAKKAIEAGCDVLVHIVTDKEIDDEFVKLAKQNEVTVVPTLWVFSSYAAVYSKQLDLLNIEHDYGDPEVIATLYQMYELSDEELGERQKKLIKEKKAIRTDSLLIKNLQKLHNAGINIAAGTDAGNVGVLHGPSLYRELQIMEKAGLSKADLIRSASENSMKMLGNDNKSGKIAINYESDLNILYSNPLDDLLNLSDIETVILGQQIIKVDSLLQITPEILAQKQLNAYNDKNLESFLKVYSEDVEIYRFPNELLYKGKEKMRENYDKFFKKAGDLHCKLVERITLGNYVIDREFVTTDIPGREEINATAIYLIENNKISKIWFL